MPLGRDQGVGAVIWSPLGWGKLTGKIRRGQPAEARHPRPRHRRHRPALRGGAAVPHRRCARRGRRGDRQDHSADRAELAAAAADRLERHHRRAQRSAARREHRRGGLEPDRRAGRHARRRQRRAGGLSRLAPARFSRTERARTQQEVTRVRATIPHAWCDAPWPPARGADGDPGQPHARPGRAEVALRDAAPPAALPARIPGVSLRRLGRPSIGGAAPGVATGRPHGRRRRRHHQARAGPRPRRRWRRCSSPPTDRSTVCVSSQAGCTRHCRVLRDRDPRASRAAHRRRDRAPVRAWRGPKRRRRAPARNVVFMGMGEPMDNLDAVLARRERPDRGGGARASPSSHVTVSTSGVAAGDERLPAGEPRSPRAVPERDHRRAARAADAAQPRLAHRARCWTRCGRTRRSGSRPALLHRIRAVAGRQRLRRGRAAARRPARRPAAPT